MSKNFQLKDSLYYSDLIYEIKKIAKLDYAKDKETELRLRKRKVDVVSKTRDGDTIRLYFETSPFQEDVFRTVRNILKKSNESFNSVDEISNYPEAVNECLENLNKMNDENMVISCLVSVIQEAKLEHAFSLGEDCEQCVCLNKKDEIWEVYIVERGIFFEKDCYIDCFDACLQVIHHLADSKQCFEQVKKEFVLRRNK